jgi:transcriptional regulator with XRE-family HTH domain
MPSRERPVDRGAALGRELVARVSGEAREARLAAGLGQSDVARAIGLSVAQLSRIERGLSPDLSLATAARLHAVLGLRLSARSYPDGDPIRDAGQRDLLVRLLERCHASLARAWEVPFPAPGDLRAWDATLRGSSFRVGIEAETRLRDVQALDRRLALKERDGGMDRLLLVVLDSRSNRTVLRAHHEVFDARFPVAGARALELLGVGADPGGNALVLL